MQKIDAWGGHAPQGNATSILMQLALGSAAGAGSTTGEATWPMPEAQSVPRPARMNVILLFICFHLTLLRKAISLSLKSLILSTGGQGDASKARGISQVVYTPSCIPIAFILDSGTSPIRVCR